LANGYVSITHQDANGSAKSKKSLPNAGDFVLGTPA
jgi:hypothetical protein